MSPQQLNSTDGASATEAASAPPLTSLWRIIPYYFLLLFGGLLAVLCLVAIPLPLLVAQYFPVATVATAMAGYAIAAVGGMLWMISARAIRWRRWRLLVITLVAGYAFGACGYFVTKRADLSPAAARRAADNS